MCAMGYPRAIRLMTSSAPLEKCTCITTTSSRIIHVGLASLIATLLPTAEAPTLPMSRQGAQRRMRSELGYLLDQIDQIALLPAAGTWALPGLRSHPSPTAGTAGTQPSM